MADLERRVKTFKIELRSVLMGMKNGASLKQLHGEYETRMGSGIPFRELGFRNVVHLMENIPDVVCLDDSSGELRVYAVADENTAHIARMVSKQKVGSRISVCDTGLWFRNRDPTFAASTISRGESGTTRPRCYVRVRVRVRQQT